MALKLFQAANKSMKGVKCHINNCRTKLETDISAMRVIARDSVPQDIVISVPLKPLRKCTGRDCPLGAIKGENQGITNGN